jgi:hypothetical protein
MICAADRAAIAEATSQSGWPARSPLEGWEIIDAVRAVGTKFDMWH